MLLEETISSTKMKRKRVFSIASSSAEKFAHEYGQIYHLLVLPGPTVAMTGKPKPTKNSRSVKDSDFCKHGDVLSL